ncbi:MAG TPA: hypothetical protein VNN79_13420, partial [Actinomycetota bacterium]|nr:hypothetical protein [Actinomycetota bacterium]
PRWRWVVWLTIASMVLVSAAITLEPGTLADEGFPELQNPLAIGALKPVLDALQLFLIAIPVCMVASAAALVVRFRRARGAERLQLTWLAMAAAVVAAVYAVALISSLGQPWGQADTAGWVSVLQNLALASFALIPISIGIAILRYRLYDIDRLISRAVSYAVVTALLVAVYAGVVVGLGTAFGRSQSPVLIAGATLLVAALFGPVRRRVQAAVDRRFNRRRYDAERVLGTFVARLRDELDLDALTGELATAASSAVQPSSIAVWIRTGRSAP